MSRLKPWLWPALVVVLVSLLAWFSGQHRYQWDWTAGGNNSLSAPSSELLERLEGPIDMTVFASKKANLRRQIQQTLIRYKRYKHDVYIHFIDPETVPDEVQRLGITTDGELRIEYNGRVEHVTKHTEQAVTNALNRVARAGERWIVYTTGHGERDLLGTANHDLGMFGDSMLRRGYLIQPVNLTEIYEIPANTALMIIAGPKVNLLDNEMNMLEAFLDNGGNLLWLSDPGDTNGLKRLAHKIGLQLSSGLVVDPTTLLHGVTLPTFPVVTRYPEHPITKGFDLITLFPETLAVHALSNENWRFAPIVITGDESWIETTQPYAQSLLETPSTPPGPITIGMAVEPAPPEHDHTQRIVVMGDGDFLSNAYLGNGGNLELGLNIINWLSYDDELIALPAKFGPVQSFNLSKTGALILAIGSLFVAPALLFATGFVVWRRRR